MEILRKKGDGMRKCSNCGVPLMPGMDFCTQCGTRYVPRKKGWKMRLLPVLVVAVILGGLGAGIALLRSREPALAESPAATREPAETTSRKDTPVQTLSPEDTAADDTIPDPDRVETETIPAGRREYSLDTTLGPVDYEIVRWDRSTENQTYYYDYVTFNSGGEGYRIIGEDQYRAAEEYMTALSQEQLDNPILDILGNPISGYWKAETQVTHNGDGVFSVRTKSEKYSGGNASDRQMLNRTYSLKTGEILELSDLFDAEEDLILKTLKEAAWEEVSSDILLDDAQATYASMDFDDFEFWVQDGEVILWIRQYLLSPGVRGPITAPTGIRVGATLESSTMGRTDLSHRGMEGPVDFVYERLSNNHKIGYDFNSTFHTDYPVLSGSAPGIGRINQDLYRIAEAFMQEKTQSELEDTHYAYGMHYGFTHTQFFSEAHNGDGIISFRINVSGFWGDEERGDYARWSGRTYDLSTGEVMQITDFVDMDLQQLQQLVQEQARKQFNYSKWEEGAMKTLENTAPEDYVFWIEDGELIICVYDDPEDIYRSNRLHTGIFLS